MSSTSGEQLPDVNRQERVAELERRIEDLEQLPDSDFGSFSVWDWVACTGGGLVLPALALWWFAG